MEIDSKNQALEKLKSKNFLEVIQTGGKKSVLHDAVSSQSISAQQAAYIIKDEDLGKVNINYKAITSDKLDEAIGKWVNANSVRTPIRRVTPGHYVLGTMLVLPRYKDEKLTAFTQVDGEMEFGAFYNKYSASELEHLQDRMKVQNASCEDTIEIIIKEVLQRFEV